MKNLPSIYKNNNINIKNNNKTKSIIKEDILENIFSMNNPYNIKVIIKTKDKVIEDYLIERNEKYIIPLNNDKINIEDIEYIKKKD